MPGALGSGILKTPLIAPVGPVINTEPSSPGGNSFWTVPLSGVCVLVPVNKLYVIWRTESLISSCLPILPGVTAPTGGSIPSILALGLVKFWNCTTEQNCVKSILVVASALKNSTPYNLCPAQVWIGSIALSICILQNFSPWMLGPTTPSAAVVKS